MIVETRDYLAHQNLLPLVTSRARLDTQKGEMRFVSTNEGIQRMLEKAGLLETFKISKTRAEALRD